MRVFIAIELEDMLKEYIFEKQQIVKSNSKKGNFSIKENFHLTLRFIGESNYEEIEALKKVIDETAKDVSTFKMKMGELGYFPRKNKKIIWLGISENQKSLQQLFNVLEKKLENEGFEREDRGLKPHITLAREVILNTEFNILSRQVQIENKDINVKKISLMESTRVNGTLRYIPIYSKHIKGL